ncbi:MAG: L-threonylcarbamoyladenylate synthase [Deltaproteobacteria bacterium]|nr:L-threonylcarbamoyladenylate synthase [Deltaproteobacteria bacterium]
MIRTIPDARVPALAPNLARAVRRAVGHLVAGGVVIAPTESSYGLFASVRSAAAVKRIVALKDRMAGHPLPLVVAGPGGLSEVAREPTRPERILMHHFWPGPLTLVLPALEGVPPEITAGTGTVGVRIPPHPIAAALCSAAGPLTATSANPTTLAAARRVDQIDPALLEHDVLVVDGGDCGDHPPSTVVRVSEDEVEILREGPISASQISAVLGR